MPPGRLLSDLVRDSQLDVELVGTCTRHVFYTSGRSADERRIRKEEEWVREAFLGQGAYGVVFKERCHDRLRAVKEIKKRVAGQELDYKRELEAIFKFSHPKYAHCFVRSHGWFESPEAVYIAMEYYELGDLQRHLTQPLPEIEARRIIEQVLEGLQFMHANDFVHRDIKPGNIIVVAKYPTWFVKISDFGTSKRRLEDVTSLHTMNRGTLAFAAPEILGLGSSSESQSYTFAVDMWSLGAVAHLILTLSAAFQGLGDLVKYVHGLTELPGKHLADQDVSENCQDFITSLIAPDPTARPTAAQAAHHPWFCASLKPITKPCAETVPGISTLTSKTDELAEIRIENLTFTEASGTWTSDKVSTPQGRAMAMFASSETLSESHDRQATPPHNETGWETAQQSRRQRNIASEDRTIVTGSGPGGRAVPATLKVRQKSRALEPNASVDFTPGKKSGEPVLEALEERGDQSPSSKSLVRQRIVVREKPPSDNDGDEEVSAEGNYQSYPDTQRRFAAHNSTSSLERTHPRAKNPSNWKTKASETRAAGWSHRERTESSKHPANMARPSLTKGYEAADFICALCQEKLVPGRIGTSKLECGHRWCSRCLEQRLEFSIKTSTEISCCGFALPSAEILYIIWSEPNSSGLSIDDRGHPRLSLCRCGEQIDPRNLDPDNGHMFAFSCQRCRSKLCAACGALWHVDHAFYLGLKRTPADPSSRMARF